MCLINWCLCTIFSYHHRKLILDKSDLSYQTEPLVLSREELPLKRRLHFFLLIPGLLIIAGIHCIEAPLEPILPTTDIQVSVPLVNRTRYFDEFVKDTLLRRDHPTGTSGYTYGYRSSVAPIGIGAIVAHPQSSAQELELGTFQVEPPPLSVTFSYRQITGTDPPPVPTPIPPATYALPLADYPAARSFEYVEFASGLVTLQVRNRLPVVVSFPDPIVIKNRRIVSPVDTSEVARFAFDGQQFQPGETRRISVSAANVRMQNVLRVLSARVQTPGSSGPILVQESDGLEFSLTFSGTSVREARARIPRQSVFSVVDSVFVVDDSLSIQSATFKEGSLTAVLQNDIDVQVVVYLKFNEIRSRSTGQSLTVRHTFDGRGMLLIPIDAREYRVEASGTTIGTVLTFSVGIETIESSDFRHLQSRDKVRAEVRPDKPFVVQSVTGRIKPTLINVSSSPYRLDLGEAYKKFKGEVTFDSLRMVLDVRMTGGFPAEYDLHLVAVRYDGAATKTDSLALPAPTGSTQKRFYPAAGRSTQIVLDRSSGLESFIQQFVPNLPDSFYVRGSILLNPPDLYSTPLGQQTIWDTTKLYTDIDVTFPLKIGIAGGVLVDMVDIGNEKKFPRDVTESIVRGTLYVEVENGLPIQMRLRSAFLQTGPLGNKDTLLWIPQSSPATILSSVVDQNGLSVNTRKSAFSITLKGSEMELVNAADILWFRFEIETPNGGKTPVRFRSTDLIRIRASANTVYTVNRR